MGQAFDIDSYHLVLNVIELEYFNAIFRSKGFLEIHEQSFCPRTSFIVLLEEKEQRLLPTDQLLFEVIGVHFLDGSRGSSKVFDSVVILQLLLLVVLEEALQILLGNVLFENILNQQLVLKIKYRHLVLFLLLIGEPQKLPYLLTDSSEGIGKVELESDEILIGEVQEGLLQGIRIDVQVTGQVNHHWPLLFEEFLQSLRIQDGQGRVFHHLNELAHAIIHHCKVLLVRLRLIEGPVDDQSELFGHFFFMGE